MKADPGQQAPVAPEPVAGWSAKKGWLWLGAIAVVFFGAFVAFPQLFEILGLNHYDAWFLDLFALLASNDAITRGLDPYAPNPLDYFGRPHVYTHWWLHLRDLGLTRADVRWLGLVLAGAFFLVAGWRLRPRTPGQLAWYAAILCSAPILLAVERCNNDIVVFLLLAPLVPFLQNSRRWVRLLAPVLLIVAVLLKYYPATAIVVLLAGTERREVRWRVVLALLLLVAAACNLARDLAGLGYLAPHARELMSFGATGALVELGREGRAATAVCTLLGGVMAVYCWFRRKLGEWEPGAPQQSSWLHFVLGAALLTGCFFTSTNFWYRLIFVLWLAPLLWELLHDPDTPVPVRRLARQTAGLLLLIFWAPLLCTFVLNRLVGVVPDEVVAGTMKWAFLVEQPFDWWFFLCLMTFVAHFARRRFAFLMAREG